MTSASPTEKPWSSDAVRQGGERVEGVIHGLEGDMADAIPHSGGDRLDTEMVAVPDGLEQCDARGRHPQAGIAQLLGGGRTPGCGHGTKPTVIDTNGSRLRLIQVCKPRHAACGKEISLIYGHDQRVNGHP